MVISTPSSPASHSANEYEPSTIHFRESSSGIDEAIQDCREHTVPVSVTLVRYAETSAHDILWVRQSITSLFLGSVMSRPRAIIFVFLKLTTWPHSRMFNCNGEAGVFEGEAELVMRNVHEASAYTALNEGSSYTRIVPFDSRTT